MKFDSRKILAVLFSILILSLPSSSQQTLGAVNGTVTDASGALVQGAKVTARNNGTNLELTATTRNDGSFEFVDLPLGTYSVSFNSVNANNLFNGKTSSYDNTARFILNTGESFSTPGQTQTSTSVYNAMGEGLPTPPVETIQEVHVTTSMYDASQGANSGAHIELTTLSGTNQFHGQAYEYFSTNGWAATPFFLKATGLPIGKSTPGLKRNVFGGTFGGPIIKDKLFFFASYQGLRVTDSLNGAVSGTVVPQGLTDQRDAATLAAVANADFGSSLTASDIVHRRSPS